MYRTLARLVLILLISSGCGGGDGSVLLTSHDQLTSITVEPRTANVGSGFAIPFNEAFRFDTARPIDPRTTQLKVLGRFSNGVVVEIPFSSTMVSFSGPEEAARISTSGLVSHGSLEQCGSTTTATVTYQSGAVSVSDTVTIETACLVATAGAGGTRADPFIARGGAYTGGFVAQFRGPDGVDRIFSGNDLLYSLKEELTGVFIDKQSGRIEVDDSVPAGQRIVVLVSYFDVLTGLTLVSEVEFEVV